jgi:hypothetical protein
VGKLCNQLELKGKKNYTNLYNLSANAMSLQIGNEIIGIYALILLKCHVDEFKKNCLKKKISITDYKSNIPIIIDWKILEHSPWHYESSDKFGLLSMTGDVSATKYANQNNISYTLNLERLNRLGSCINFESNAIYDHEILIYTECIKLSKDNLDFLNKVNQNII